MSNTFYIPKVVLTIDVWLYVQVKEVNTYFLVHQTYKDVRGGTPLSEAFTCT